MASPSSFPSRNYRYNVFASFHGPDVRKTLLSHMREQFKRNRITMFDDQEIERSATIAPSLTQAIRESRISIVILSKKYASSSWCLDELVEILSCKKSMGQIVMTVFYGVVPTDVRKQTGEFGIAFNETCDCKNEEERLKWSKALNDVGNIAGEVFSSWDNEAKMIKKIARDISDKLNATPSRDFDGMVGLDAHLSVMETLLDIDSSGVKIVAITGPVGIGKTTIARALQSKLSQMDQRTCFVDNLRGSYHSGLYELRLQEQFLSKVLNQDGVTVCHSGVIEERLCKQRVFIFLDDVNHIKQLEALAGDISWFGPGSRIVITTENKELLQQHGINNSYHVGFPSYEESVEILCRYAFRQSYPKDGFKELSQRVTELCGNLPLGLQVVGSSLRGKEVDEWEEVIRRLETVLDRDIEDILRVGYENLDENEQLLFLHIAIFFNYKDGELVKTMFLDSDVDVIRGLKILANKSLIEISKNGDRIVMHRLLQQLGKKAIHKQEPWKRRILIDTPEIFDVLENETGTANVVGISFDVSRIDEVFIGTKAFKRMPNLRFLRVYKSRDDGNDRMHIPRKVEFPRRLRLLHWEAYPSKYLPPSFGPEYLVKLNLPNSKLEKLWEGTQTLTNLKKMVLSWSMNLKELPDLSKATNLEKLNLEFCGSLVEIPSSFLNLHKLQYLEMAGCKNLQVIPDHLNLASLMNVNMWGCSGVRQFQVISTNIKKLVMAGSMLEELPSSIEHCTRLSSLDISWNEKLARITHLPSSLMELDLSYTTIERIPDCISALHQLLELNLNGCTRLVSLPELPEFVWSVLANDCESLENVVCSSYSPHAVLSFINCFKLGEQARRDIIGGSLRQAILPGREVPVECKHRARGNSLTIRRPGKTINSTIKVRLCVLLSPNRTAGLNRASTKLMCRHTLNREYFQENVIEVGDVSKCQTRHLFVFYFGMVGANCKEIAFDFSSQSHDFKVIQCGAHIQEITHSRSHSQTHSHSQSHSDQIDCWSWLFLCFNNRARAEMDDHQSDEPLSSVDFEPW